jgi:hypothetical protein
MASFLKITGVLHISCKEERLVLGFPHTVKQSVTCQSNIAFDGKDWQVPVNILPFPLNDPLEKCTWFSGILIRQVVKSITLSL